MYYATRYTRYYVDARYSVLNETQIGKLVDSKPDRLSVDLVNARVSTLIKPTP